MRRLGRRWRRLERFPFERNHSNDRKSLKIKMLEQALIEKVCQLFRKRALMSPLSPRSPRFTRAGGAPDQIRINPSVSAIATACVLLVALSLREALRM